MSRPRKTKPVAAGNVARITDSVRHAPNPIPSLTPANLAAYLDSFRRGYLRDTAILWDSIQWRDDRVAADCGKRHKSIARYGYTVQCADGQDAESPAVSAQIDAVKFCLENLTSRDALDASVRGGLSGLVRQQMRAVGFQWQVHELVWRPLPGGLTVESIACPLWWFERTTGALRYLPQDLMIDGVPLEADGWMVTRGDGLMAATCVLYLLKRMSLTDWAAYNGRVGPGIHGKTSAQPGSDAWNQLEDAVDNFGFDLKVVTQDGVTITPIEMALKGTLPWPEMYAAMTKAISVLWRGGNLSTDSAGGPDQSGVTLQGAEKDLLEQDDAEMVSDAINDYIVTPLIRYRFGVEPLVWVEWNTGAKPDQKQQLDVDRFLAERGWPFSVEDLAERYDRSPPAAGATILVPPVSPMTSVAINSSPAADPQQETESARRAIVAAAVNQTAAAQADMLAAWLADLEAAIAGLAPEAALDAMEAAIRAMPATLLTRANVERLARIAEGAQGASMVNVMLATLEPEAARAN